MYKEYMIHPRGSQKSSQRKWCLNWNMKDFNRMKEEYYGTVTRKKKADGGRVGREVERQAWESAYAKALGK